MNWSIVALGFPGNHKSVVIMRADDEPVPYFVGGRTPTLEPIEHSVRHVLNCMFGWDALDIPGNFEVAITQIEVSITHLKMTEDDELSLRSTPSHAALPKTRQAFQRGGVWT